MLHEPVARHRVRRETIEIKMRNTCIYPTTFHVVTLFLPGPSFRPSPFFVKAVAIALLVRFGLVVVRFEEEGHAEHAEMKRTRGSGRRITKEFVHRAVEVPLADVPIGS